MTRSVIYCFLILVWGSAAHAAQPALNTGPVAHATGASSGVVLAMESWINAVASKQTREIDTLLDAQSRDFYLRIQQMALTASARELSVLPEVEQLQVMFFRSMLEREELKKMNVQQLTAFAVHKGFIGMELRRGDALREITIEGDTAQGRLFKFGRADRPDPYLQYFVKEQGVWRVSLRGERERLVGVFNDFVGRSQLPRAEAAFLILEMRLMRKFTPADFAPQVANTGNHTLSAGAKSLPATQLDPAARYRVVSLRLPESLIGRPAVALDDSSSGLKIVLHPGDVLPAYPDFVLRQVTPDQAIFRRRDHSADTVTLQLNSRQSLIRKRDSARGDSTASFSLFDIATLGEKYPDQMMTQWRNIGLRGRPQLLQQAWLTPDFGGAIGPEKTMLGLRVRQVMPASFWDQLGLQDGDLLTEVNGATINSLDTWKAVIELAQTQQKLLVKLKRGANELAFRTLTVRPG